jgi:hypothetical protein
MGLYQFLYSINPRAVWPGLLALIGLLCLAAAVMTKPPAPGSRIVRTLQCSAVLAILVVLPLHAALLIAYLHYPSYLDHMEANVAAVSWLGWQRYPIYPSLTTGDVYGVPYGPVVYQGIGFALWLLGPSIASSKAFCLVAFFLVQVLSFIVLRRSGASTVEALAITAAQCAVQAGFTSQGYAGGVRSDVLIFLAVEAAMLAATARPRMVNAIAIGLLGGIVVNLKIHGGLYLLPAFVYFVLRSDSPARRLRLVATAVAAGTAGLAIPFLPHNVSVVNYIDYFATMRHHTIERWLLEKNVVFAAALFSPLALLFICCGRKLPARFAVFLPTLAVCMLLVTIPAAEDGAGPYHLLPFLPSVCWAFSSMRRMVERTSQGRQAVRCEAITLATLLALLIGYGPITIISWNRCLQSFADTTQLRRGIAEIDQAVHDNPAMSLAVGPGLDPYDTLLGLRVIPVFRGSPLPIDNAAWMTFQSDGVDDAVVRHALTICRVGRWLLPSEPFASDAYSNAVRAAFRANYSLWKPGRVFNEWRCSHH